MYSFSLYTVHLHLALICFYPTYKAQAYLDVLCFSVLCITDVACFKMEGKALHQQNVTTPFIARLVLLWWSGTKPVISLRYVCIHGSWQKTHDSWCRDKGLYYSRHSRQHKHHVCVSPPGPQIPMGVARRGPDGSCMCCFKFTSPLRNLCLGNLLLFTKQ